MIVVVLLTLCFLHLRDRLADHRYLKPGLWIGGISCLFLVAVITIGNRSEAARGSVSVLTPLYSYMEAITGKNTEILRSNFMNVLLFYPAGLLIGSGLPQRWMRWQRVLLIMLLGIVISGCIEYCQYRYCLGICEVDDVIHNTLGATLGALPGTAAYRRNTP